MALVVDDKHHDVVFDQFVAAVETSIDASNSNNATGPNVVRVAFDCEGVNLSRIGTVELVAVCFGRGGGEAADGQVFVLDLNGKGEPAKLRARIDTLKILLECDTVQKVIHDARMDCDALFHLHHIRVVNLHDTSCFHAVETGQADQPLNTVLAHHGIEENGTRDKSVYRRNPRYWETRPLTRTMIEWSSSDVDKLLTVAELQYDVVEARGLCVTALRMSDENAVSASDIQLQRGLVCRTPIGRFIGPGGSNIRSLQGRTNTNIYQDRETSTWMVYHKTQSDLNKVKRAMGY